MVAGSNWSTSIAAPLPTIPAIEASASRRKVGLVVGRDLSGSRPETAPRVCSFRAPGTAPHGCRFRALGTTRLRQFGGNQGVVTRLRRAGPSCGRRFLLLGVVSVALLLASAARASETLGLDHIPVVVNDLEQTCGAFRAFGFALKPGRDHVNGIRNAHVKFPTGAGIELLTAFEPGDALAAHYAELCRGGEGPAFVSFHARDTQRLHAALHEGGYDFRQEGSVTVLPSPEFAYLFLVRDNRSPTDRPEHFAHTNGATALSAVWIATESGDSLARLLVHLGGRERRGQVLAPGPVEATIISLGEGEVVILPKEHQILAGRPVIGASFTVSDLRAVRLRLIETQAESWNGAVDTDRVVVAPGHAPGMWLEFRSGS